MATSTHRLLLIVVFINILIGVVGEIYYNPTSYSSTNPTLETQLIAQYEQETYSNEGIWGGIKANAERLYENTIGSVLRWGRSILNIILIGINPFSIKPTDFNTTVEQIFATLLTLFRTIMGGVVLGLEIYQLFKNKKTS